LENLHEEELDSLHFVTKYCEADKVWEDRIARIRCEADIREDRIARTCCVADKVREDRTARSCCDDDMSGRIE
jgi:hypothetical protein